MRGLRAWHRGPRRVRVFLGILGSPGMPWWLRGTRGGQEALWGACGVPGGSGAFWRYWWGLGRPGELQGPRVWHRVAGGSEASCGYWGTWRDEFGAPQESAGNWPGFNIPSRTSPGSGELVFWSSRCFLGLPSCCCWTRTSIHSRQTEAARNCRLAPWHRDQLASGSPPAWALLHRPSATGWALGRVRKWVYSPERVLDQGDTCPVFAQIC